MTDIKQVIVMRTDLNLRKGKMIAQGAHASMQFLVRALENGTGGALLDRTFNDVELSKIQHTWLKSGMTKICVKAEDETHLLSIYDRAKELEITTHVVRDAGHTEIPAGTLTCVAIGPDLSERVDLVTGALKLL